MKTDLIIIGGGPGGYRAAAYAAKKNLKVVVFEQAELGGTCLNEGCIPTKAFAHNAELMEQLRSGDAYGLTNLNYEVDFVRVVARKDQVVAQLRSGIETLLSHPNITLVRGRAVFRDSHTVELVGPSVADASAVPSTFQASHVIIATGSQPKMLRLKNYEEGAACDSSFLLQNTQLPRRLCIVGAGVIGMEFASIFNSFGVDVTVVEYLKECLPALDSEIAKRLRKTLEKRGIRFVMQSAVTSITKGQVTWERKGKEETLETDLTLMAVGRAPRVSDDFQLAGFQYDRHAGILVNEHLQTTVPHIYAIGDVNGCQMLAHAAEMQAMKAIDHIIGETDDVRLDIMPSAIFTNPEAASVGLSEDQCKAQGIAYTCHKSFYRANGKALAMNESDGMVKLLADNDQYIIGCHVYGAHAADVAQEASVLMCRRTTLEALRHMVHIHPTLSEVLHEAACQ